MGSTMGEGAGCAVRPLLSASLVVAALLAGATVCRAVVTFDLLHDSPRTRELLKQELGAAAPPAREASTAAAAPAGRGDLEAIWFARERYLEIGETEKAQAQLQLLWETAVGRGIRNLPEYGAVLVREAERRMGTRDWDQAARALGYARRLAPDELSVYATGALLALRRSPFNFVGAWEELAQGARAARRSFRLQAWVTANLFLTAVAGLAFLFAFATAVLFAANARRVVHDIRESIRAGSPRVRTALSWGAVAAPALIGLSPWWWLMVAALLLWPYVDRTARGILAAGAVFVLALPSLVGESAALLAVPGRPLLEAVVRVREGNWTEADYRELRAHADRGTAGVAGLSALGMAARRLGLLDEAEAALQAGLKAAPNDPALWNNLGNVAFARKDFPRAVERYTKAAGIAPDLFAPHYTLGLAHREEFKFAEGEAESRRAGEIDAEAVAFYAGLGTVRREAPTVDALPATADLWRIARARDEARDAAAEGLWDSLMLGPSPGAWPFVAGVLFALGGALGAVRLRWGPARQCLRCGRVFCARCQGSPRGELCSQCHHIFVKKEGVDARVRVQKMGEIKDHRRLLRIRHLACAALAPGGGHLSAGRVAAGALFLAPAAFFEARFILGAGAFPSPWSLGSRAGGRFLAAGAAAFALWWLASLWLTWRMEE